MFSYSSNLDWILWHHQRVCDWQLWTESVLLVAILTFTSYIFSIFRKRRPDSIEDGKPTPLCDGTLIDNRRLFAYAKSLIVGGIKCDKRGNVYGGCRDGILVWRGIDGVLLGRILFDGGVLDFCFTADEKRLFILNRRKLYVARFGLWCLNRSPLENDGLSQSKTLLVAIATSIKYQYSLVWISHE